MCGSKVKIKNVLLKGQILRISAMKQFTTRGMRALKVLRNCILKQQRTKGQIMMLKFGLDWIGLNQGAFARRAR